MSIIDGHLFLTHVKHYAAIMPNAIEFEVSGKMYYVDHFITRLSIELVLVFLIIKRDFIRDPIVCYIFIDFVGAIGNVGELLFHGYVTDYIGFSYSGGDGVLINFSDMLIGSGGYVSFVVVIVHLVKFLKIKRLEFFNKKYLFK